MKALMSSNCCSAACFSRALVLQPFVFSLCYNLLFFFVLKPSFSFNTATFVAVFFGTFGPEKPLPDLI